MARPNTYTTKQKVAIIDRIANGMMDGQSLRKICSGKDFPPKTTVLRWLADEENEELVTIIAEARKLLNVPLHAVWNPQSDA